MLVVGRLSEAYRHYCLLLGELPWWPSAGVGARSGLRDVLGVYFHSSLGVGA